MLQRLERPDGFVELFACLQVFDRYVLCRLHHAEQFGGICQLQGVEQVGNGGRGLIGAGDRIARCIVQGDRADGCAVQRRRGLHIGIVAGDGDQNRSGAARRRDKKPVRVARARDARLHAVERYGVAIHCGSDRRRFVADGPRAFHQGGQDDRLACDHGFCGVGGAEGAGDGGGCRDRLGHQTFAELFGDEAKLRQTEREPAGAFGGEDRQPAGFGGLGPDIAVDFRVGIALLPQGGRRRRGVR